MSKFSHDDQETDPNPENIISITNGENDSTIGEVRSVGLSDIEKISMELLINNRMFTKYLSRTDPIKYEEYIKYRETISHYEYKIIGITKQLLQSPRLQINNEINETFHNYIKSCINYLENKELQEKCTKDSYSDDEILFDERYMNETPTLTKSHSGKPSMKSNNHLSMDIQAFSSQNLKG